jgi:hypothetical protein
MTIDQMMREVQGNKTTLAVEVLGANYKDRHLPSRSENGHKTNRILHSKHAFGFENMEEPSGKESWETPRFQEAAAAMNTFLHEGDNPVQQAAEQQEVINNKMFRLAKTIYAEIAKHSFICQMNLSKEIQQHYEFQTLLFDILDATNAPMFQQTHGLMQAELEADGLGSLDESIALMKFPTDICELQQENRRKFWFEEAKLESAKRS